MKIAILAYSRNFSNFENKRFIQTFLKHNVCAHLIDPEKCSIELSNGACNIYYENTLLDKYDYLIPRIGCMIGIHEKHVINAFVNTGTISFNTADQIALIADKFATYQLLSNNGIPIINTIKHKDNNCYLSDVKYPCVLKSNTGSLGVGIYKVERENELINLIDHSRLLDSRYNFLVQEFISDEVGVDYRIFLLDGEIIGSMKRSSLDGSFKANYSIHNNAISFTPESSIREMCSKIYDVVGARIIGIDLLLRDGEFVVCELNSAPGFNGLEKTNQGINIPKIILDTIKKNQN